jgi:predicted nucleic acid-binding protein
VRLALDTNVLAYAEGVGDLERMRAATGLVEALPSSLVVLPAQVLGELYRVLAGKTRRAPDTCRGAVHAWADAFEVADSSWTAFEAAFDLAVAHGLQFWDALILSVAAEQRCRFLLTEDLRSGFTWRGVTVVDPFAAPMDPRIASLLGN